MRESRRLPWLTWSITLSLFVSMLAGTFSVKSVAARSSADKPKEEKMSADLREHARNARGNERVSVIVQPTGQWRAEQDDAVVLHGGRVKQRFDNLGMHVIELPVSAVETLAARDDVEYISPDREIESSGTHISTTSGASISGASSGRAGLDGTGIGIAIFDSGVESTYLGFNTNKIARIVKSVDFTGEGITTDKYGHGTHVASIATGTGATTTSTVDGVTFSTIEAWLSILRRSAFASSIHRARARSPACSKRLIG